MRRYLLMGVLGLGLGLVGGAAAEPPDGKAEPTPKKSGSLPPARATDVEVVKRVNAARREYEASLRKAREHYEKAGDKLRLQWSEQELLAFHLMFKPSYNLDVEDVPGPDLEARVNVRDANELFRLAIEYKGKGLGSDYVLNMRRAEVLLRKILEDYPNSDKIGEVAYQLAEVYESRAYRQFDRSARFFERSFQWVKGSRTDARLRAAVLYDRQLNERSKAIELYRSVVEHDIDPDRIKTAERRLAELTGGKK